MRNPNLILLLLAVMFLASCAPVPYVVSIRGIAAPPAHPVYSRIIIFCPYKNLPMRKAVEYRFRDTFEKYGLKGFASADLFEPGVEINNFKLDAVISENKVDGVLFVAYKQNDKAAAAVTSDTFGGAMVIGNNVYWRKTTTTSSSSSAVRFASYLYEPEENSLAWTGEFSSGRKVFTDLNLLFDDLAEYTVIKIFDDQVLKHTMEYAEYRKQRKFKW